MATTKIEEPLYYVEISKENLIECFGEEDGKLFWSRFLKIFKNYVEDFENHLCTIDRNKWERYKKEKESQAPE